MSGKIAPGQLVAFTFRDPILGGQLKRSAVVVSTAGEDVELRVLSPELLTVPAGDVEPIDTSS